MCSSRNEKGDIILHQIAKRSNIPDDIKVLVKAGADVNANDKHANTPLHFDLYGYRSKL